MSWIKGLSWKKKNSAQIIEASTNLGLERRQYFRIAYPNEGAVGDLPTITFAGHSLQIQNISTGGCCLFDPNEVLGPAVGQEISLHLHWLKDSHHVRGRIVSRVENRRHIQFLNLSERNQQRIRLHIEPSFRGSALRKVEASPGTGLTIEACEIWVSTLEDGVTLFDHPHLTGSILFQEQDFLCYRRSLPVYGNQRKRVVAPDIYDALILFLANVPNPSEQLQSLAKDLSLLGQERFR